MSELITITPHLPLKKPHNQIILIFLYLGRTINY